jgi:hypothetical protein
MIEISCSTLLNACDVSGACTTKTPLKNVTVDDALRDALLSTGKFELMDKATLPSS